MTAAFSLILSGYCLLLLVFLYGWVRIRRQNMPVKGVSPGISIVVAMRNEENNIQNLTHHLSAIVYPPGKFEVILVNDHSADATHAKAESFSKGNSSFLLLDLPDGTEGKKEALRFGIERANFEIIATTDADCSFSKNWLQCLSLYFQNQETKMVIGAVKLATNSSFFSRLQVTEFASLTGTTAAAIGLGHPIMSNGANLAFRKDTFREVNGYDGNLKIASGDDEFLMRKIFKRYPAGISFLNFYEATVTSLPQESLLELFHQRLRWAGKWKYNSDLLTRLLAVFILLSQIALVGLAIGNFREPDGTAGIVILKLFLEGVFLYWVGRFLDRKFDFLSFLTLQVIYPLYVIGVGILSFVYSYKWKDRNY